MPALNNCRVLRTGLFLFPVTNVFQNTNSLCLKVVPNSLYLAQGPYLKYWWFCTTVKAEGKDRGDHCKLLWLLLCAMPCLQKSHLQTLRHLTEFGFKVIISQERKNRCREEEPCLRRPQGGWNRSQTPSYQELQALKIPQSRRAEHKRETHHGEEMFSHKSNFLQFVFQQQIHFQFQMPLFKSDRLPFD